MIGNNTYLVHAWQYQESIDDDVIVGSFNFHSINDAYECALGLAYIKKPYENEGSVSEYLFTMVEVCIDTRATIAVLKAPLNRRYLGLKYHGATVNDLKEIMRLCGRERGAR